MRDGRAHASSFQPMCGTVGASSLRTRPASSPSPSPALVALLEEQLEPDADAEHGPAVGHAVAQHVRERPEPCGRASRTWPTPATIASGASATSAGSLVTTGSAPARASAEQTLRRLPAP